MNGDSIAGFFVAIQTFVPKIVLAASLSLPLAFMAAVGFVEPICPPDANGLITDRCDKVAPEPQTDQVRWFISLLFCVGPTLATLLSMWWKFQYPIKTTAQATAINVALKEHARVGG